MRKGCDARIPQNRNFTCVLDVQSSFRAKRVAFRGAPVAPPPPQERDRKKSERKFADMKVRGSRAAHMRV